MTEAQLHKQICTYIKLQYPKAIFNTDLSGFKMTIGQTVQASKLRSSSKFPDIQIFETGKANGLFLEVKKTTPYLKKGTLSKNKHIQEQSEMHKKLRRRGYFVFFVWTFQDAKEIIDNYLK